MKNKTYCTTRIATQNNRKTKHTAPQEQLHNTIEKQNILQHKNSYTTQQKNKTHCTTRTVTQRNRKTKHTAPQEQLHNTIEKQNILHNKNSYTTQ